MKPEQLPQATTEDLLFEALLAVIVKKPLLFSQELQNISPQLTSSGIGSVLVEIKNIDAEKFKFGDLLKRYDDRTKMRLEVAYLKSQEMLKDFSDDDLKNEFFSIMRKLEHRDITATLAGLEYDIKVAEGAKDTNKLNFLLAKFNDLAMKLKK